MHKTLYWYVATFADTGSTTFSPAAEHQLIAAAGIEVTSVWSVGADSVDVWGLVSENPAEVLSRLEHAVGAADALVSGYTYFSLPVLFANSLTTRYSWTEKNATKLRRGCYAVDEELGDLLALDRPAFSDLTANLDLPSRPSFDVTRAWRAWLNDKNEAARQSIAKRLVVDCVLFALAHARIRLTVCGLDKSTQKEMGISEPQQLLADFERAVIDAAGAKVARVFDLFGKTA